MSVCSLSLVIGLARRGPDAVKCKGKQSERCPVINLRLLISSERFSSGEARVKRLEEVEEEEDDEESLSSFDWFWVCFNLAADRGTRLLRGSE